MVNKAQIKKSPKIDRVYKSKGSPSRKSLAILIAGVDAAEKRLKEGEADMARREEAGMQPLTMKRIKAHTNMFGCSKK